MCELFKKALSMTDYVFYFKLSQKLSFLYTEVLNALFRCHNLHI